MTARNCAWCGADISHKAAHAKFCSCRCKKRLYRHQNRHISAKECVMCGQQFDASGRKHKRIVCSDECWRGWDRLSHARRNKRPVSLIGPPIPMQCKECGANHLNKNGRDGFCSTFCKGRYYRRGEAHKQRVQTSEYKSMMVEAYRKYRKTEKGRAAYLRHLANPMRRERQREYNASEAGKASARSYRRRRAAAAALSAILLPTQSLEIKE